MPDWKKIVRDRLCGLKIDGASESEIFDELAQHLATFGARKNDDGTFSWKFDPYQRSMAPHRLLPDDHVSLWSRITCPCSDAVACRSPRASSTWARSDSV